MTKSTSPTSSGSRALVGSSNRSTSGVIASARAMPTRCFWPPDRRAGYSSRLAAMPTCSSSARACASAVLRSRLSTWTGAAMTFCSTVRCGQRAKCWNTMPIRVRTARLRRRAAEPEGNRRRAVVQRAIRAGARPAASSTFRHQAPGPTTKASGVTTPKSCARRSSISPARMAARARRRTVPPAFPRRRSCSDGEQRLRNLRRGLEGRSSVQKHRGGKIDEDAKERGLRPHGAGGGKALKRGPRRRRRAPFLHVRGLSPPTGRYRLKRASTARARYRCSPRRA